MDHPYGWLSLLPPVAAIVLAIATRRVIASLLGGVFLGSLILAVANAGSAADMALAPVTAVASTVNDFLWPVLINEDKVYVAAFTILMGAMVGVINRAGGMRGLVDVVSQWASNRQRGQLTVWLLGLMIFFDDYANTILLGGTLRPLCDRLKISREKLAYLIDSTAAPVAGLALISTWVATEIDYVQAGIDKLPGGVDWNATDIFVASIFYRFYVWLALLLVPIIGLLNRDFGPMLTAERNAQDGEATGLEHQNAEPESDDTSLSPGDATPRWWNAVAPVLLTVAIIVWMLYGVDAGTNAALLWGSLIGAVTAGLLAVSQRILSLPQVSAAAAKGASLMLPALAILWFASALSSMTGNDPSASDASDRDASHTKAVAALQAFENAGIPLAEQVAYLTKQETPPATIAAAMSETGAAPDDIAAALAANDVKGQSLAAAMSAVDAQEDAVLAALASHGVEATELPTRYENRRYRLYTGQYLGSLLNNRLPPWLMPTVVFLLAGAVAFSTGSSWSTMGIVMPLVIPLVYSTLSGDSDALQFHPILLGSVGGVLAGAIFGDHCSPISDTTVLSSQSSGCDHMSHVRTQLPYALLAGTVAVVCGTLPLGLGVPVYVLLPVGLGVMLAVVALFAKRTDTQPHGAESVQD